MNLTFSLYPVVSTPRLTRERFFSPSMPEETVRKHFARIQDESYRGFLDMLKPHMRRPKQVTTPMLVLGAANDTLFSRREVAATARAYNTEAVIFPDLAHDMMLDANWQAVAERMRGWLAEQGL